MKYSTKEIQSFTNLLMNIFIGIALFFIVIYTFAPLFGGVFSFTAWLYYGSWIVLAICVKYEANNILNYQDKKLSYIVINIIEICCYIIWLGLVCGIAFSGILIVIKAIGFKHHINNQRSLI